MYHVQYLYYQKYATYTQIQGPCKISLNRVSMPISLRRRVVECYSIGSPCKTCLQVLLVCFYMLHFFSFQMCTGCFHLLFLIFTLNIHIVVIYYLCSLEYPVNFPCTAEKLLYRDTWSAFCISGILVCFLHPYFIGYFYVSVSRLLYWTIRVCLHTSGTC